MHSRREKWCYLNSLTITRGAEKRSIELWQGDLTKIAPEEAVDILVVSSFSNNYWPMPGTLIGALHKKGISVQKLSEDKQEDLRATCSCWLSKEIQSKDPGIQFKHILCFEPSYKVGKPTDVVGDIFRSLVPFIISDSHPMQVAMPLVSTGNVGEPVGEMVEALFTAAIHWMESGLPLQRLKIVEIDPLKAAEIKGAFSIVKRHHQRNAVGIGYQPNYDIFLSYSHENTADANWLIEQIRQLKPDVRIFVDYQGLQPGVAWQEKLYRCIDDAHKVIAVYSPAYVKSKACQEEFNFASLLHSRQGEKTLFPVLLYDTQLLPHMSKWQYLDCRVADQDKMLEACKKLVSELSVQ